MHLLDVYRAQMKIALIDASQYRVAQAISLLRWFVEPVVYLVVWSTIARHSGGQVGGYTPDEFAGYYIGWTLVRQATIGWDPHWMEQRIRQGEFNALLLRPLHPIHVDTAQMLGWKLTELLTLIPTMAVLTLLFRPQLDLHLWSALAFFPALLLAFVLRYVLMYALAMTAFWTTRVTALFRLWFQSEFFLSGRIAPLSLLPPWALAIASVLPFKWSFSFPLELLLGRLTPQQALGGFAAQLAWIAVMVAALVFVWRFATRHYTAVGG
jgi:ABC-2 type transport system permease protein